MLIDMDEQCKCNAEEVSANGVEATRADADAIARRLTDLEKTVPQSHLYSRVPQTLACAFQSECTA